MDEDEEGRKRRKRSRWAGTDNDKTFIPGMPTILPAGMTPDQQQAYLGKARFYLFFLHFITRRSLIQNPEMIIGNCKTVEFLLFSIFSTFVCFSILILYQTNSGACPRFLTIFLTVQLQIEEISRKLRTGDLGIALNPEERFEII